MVNNNNQEKKVSIEKKRHIIYVDASSLNGRFKIGLYDKTNKVKHTLALGNSIHATHNAEQYAVLYGLMYIQKLETDNLSNYVLMNDCENAIQNQQLVSMGELFMTRLIWIPREINKADKIAKSKVNKKKKVWKNLNFFMKILQSDKNSILVSTIKKSNHITLQTMNNIVTSENYQEEALAQKRNTLSKKSKMTHDELVKNNNLFPIRLIKLSPFIVESIKKYGKEYKKGDSKKIIKELCDKKILTMKNKSYYLVK